VTCQIFLGQQHDLMWAQFERTSSDSKRQIIGAKQGKLHIRISTIRANDNAEKAA
jgi:hypothetical protein